MANFFAFISRMKFINRWSLMRNTSYESLSVHSQEVSIIAHALCVIGNKRLKKNYNADTAATIALYHAASGSPLLYSHGTRCKRTLCRTEIRGRTCRKMEASDSYA